MLDHAAHRRVNGTILFVDTDSPKAPPVSKMFAKIRIFCGTITVQNVCYARTARGWHIMFEISQKLNDPERIALECILGDDRMRSALNLSRYLGMRGKRIPQFWKKRWNLLFKAKLQ